VIQRHGWNLLFHECLSEQLQKLQAAAERAHQQDPQGFESNANVRLFAALSKLIFDAMPHDPYVIFQRMLERGRPRMPGPIR
jgi:toxin YhaV